MARPTRALRWATSWARPSVGETSRRKRTVEPPALSLETDLLIDRRRLKRRLIFWRTLAVLAVIAAILVGLHGRGLVGPGGGGAYVARVKVDGIIAGEEKLTRRIAALGDDPAVKAVLVEIDSPGGSVTGGESLHDAIARVAARKPTVAVMGGVAASAGYMIAAPTTRIFARQGTLTGSIGVYLQTAEISGLLDKLGVTTDAIKSGPLKDEPNPFEKTTPEGRQVLQGLVMDYYDQFVTMVAQGRHMDPDAVRRLADGRPYTGRQALRLGLIDQIGGEREARLWLASAKGVPVSLPVHDVGQPGLAARVFGASVTEISGIIWKSLASQWLTLDGVWAVWHRPAG